MMRQALIVVLCFWSAAALSETLYIKDELKVGVRNQPNSNESPFAVVETGDKLEVLERNGGYIKIRSEGGVEGWINQLYATEEAPARVQLKDLSSENKQLYDKIRVLEETLAKREKQYSRLEKVQVELQAESDKLSAELQGFRRQQPESEPRPLWQYYLGAALGLFVLGLFLGYKWHRDRVARRLGGLKI